MRRPVLLLALLGAATAVLRRRSRRSERDLWSEVTGPPAVRDLR